MYFQIFTHIVAAVVAVLAFVGGRRIVARLRNYSRQTLFWKSQNLEAVINSGVLEVEQLPPPVLLAEDRWALNMAIQVVSLAREYGILSFVESNPGCDAETIAVSTGLSGRHIRAGMEVLRSIGVVESLGEGYIITPQAGIYLLRDSPFSVAFPYEINSRMLECFRGGSSPRSVTAWARGKSQDASEWAMEMHRQSFPLGFALHATGVLGDSKNILDVAGGAGSVCIALALKDQSRKLSMIELPGSIPFARKMISRYGLSERVRCLGMDMFAQDWPNGFDAVLFTNVFHDWDEDRCRILARKAHTCLRAGGIAIVLESLLHDDAPGPLWTACRSVEMAMEMLGRQFRRRDLETILSSVGFSNVEVHSLTGYYSVIVAARCTGED